MTAPILKFHLDPIECAHRGSVHVRRDGRGSVWVECRRCGQRGIGFIDQNRKVKPSGLSMAAASFWAGDYALIDMAYRHQEDAPDNPSRSQFEMYWRSKRRGSSDEGA